MAPRRWLLLVLAFGSLAMLAYGGVSWAFSVPVSDEAAASMRLADAPGLPDGERAIVVPIADSRIVPTFLGGGDPTLGHPGALLALGRNEQSFPVGAQDVTFARALAHVAPDANGTYEPANLTLVGVPAPAENETAPPARDYTVDTAALAQGRTGYLVKGDNETDVRFVPEADVLGQVVRFDDPSTLALLLLTSSLGFVLPMVTLVATHRGAGRTGAGRAGEALPSACPECRAPLAAEADFCTRCGAWRPGKGS